MDSGQERCLLGWHNFTLVRPPITVRLREGQPSGSFLGLMGGQTNAMFLAGSTWVPGTLCCWLLCKWTKSAYDSDPVRVKADQFWLPDKRVPSLVCSNWLMLNPAYYFAKTAITLRWFVRQFLKSWHLDVRFQSVFRLFENTHGNW